MKKSIKRINLLELTFGLFVFMMLRQFPNHGVRVVFMLPVIFLLSLPAGRYSQPILTKKNIFDMVYGFLGTLVILLIIFIAPNIANVVPTGEFITINYWVSSTDIPLEYFPIINDRATSILTILFLTVIPAISIAYTVVKDIVRSSFKKRE